MSFRWTVLSTALGVALNIAATCQAAPISYSYTLIADSGGRFGGFGPSVPLNSSGTAAFFANLTTGGVGIFTGSGGPLATIADTTGPLSFGFGGIAINDQGTVAFPSGLRGGGVGIFTGSGGSITTIADSSSGFVAVGEPVSINNPGTVAFSGSRGPSTSGLFTGSGGPIITLYDISPGSPFFTFGSPAINNDGTVAFLAGIRGTGGMGDVAGILTGTGGPTVTIVDETGALIRLSSRPDINESGAVAFDADLRRGGQGIFVGRGGPITTIVDTSGLFGSFPGQNPIINNIGGVVFLATLDTGGLGIFTGWDPVADKVIATGDTLFGSMVLDLPTNGARLGFNDTGQVAFSARLADGRQVIARADPTVVPEPSAMALLGTGTVFLLSYGWRRRMRR